MTKQHGFAAKGYAGFTDPNFGGIDDGHDYSESAYHYLRNRVLDLTDERLKELYHEVWTELIRRGAETVREAAE